MKFPNVWEESKVKKNKNKIKVGVVTSDERVRPPWSLIVCSLPGSRLKKKKKIPSLSFSFCVWPNNGLKRANEKKKNIYITNKNEACHRQQSRTRPDAYDITTRVCLCVRPSFTVVKLKEATLFAKCEPYFHSFQFEKEKLKER